MVSQHQKMTGWFRHFWGLNFHEASHPWSFEKIKPLWKFTVVNNLILHLIKQTILMLYHALIVIFDKAAEFEVVVYCKL